MKQETIEQLLQIAGKQEYTQTMTMHISQVKAMLEAAYEAGQRDLSYMTKPEPEYKPYNIMIQDETGNLRPISTGS